MISFILLALVIIVLSLLMLIWPLLKPKANQVLRRDEQNILFAKNRLAELEQQLQDDAISKQDYDALKSEIETTLARDIELSNATETPRAPIVKETNGVVIALLCTLIPFGGLIFYQITGTPAALKPENMSVQSLPSAPSSSQGQDIQQMVAAVEQRLTENPNDIQGWTILARTYTVLERYDDAIKANLALLQLTGENATIYTQLADATALQSGGRIAGQASEYIKKALAIDSEYPQALWLAGLEAAQTGDKNVALNYWNKLMPLLADSPQQQQELQDIIAQTIGQAAPTTNTSQPSNLADSGKTETEESAAGGGITVSVTIDSTVESQVRPEDTVFVFATAQNGPPAPLAVKRLSVAQLPTTVQLSDADAMMAQFKLSLFEDVAVTARLSKSGNPIAQPGDFQSDKINSKNTNTDVIELIISELVE